MGQAEGGLAGEHQRLSSSEAEKSASKNGGERKSDGFSGTAKALSSSYYKNTDAEDSDSAVILDDPVVGVGEISFAVPTLKGPGQPLSVAEAARVSRSISDVVKVREQQSLERKLQQLKQRQDQQQHHQLQKRKEERKMTNRQKLLTIAKRHSGFLKRPEILETVYSVEEDAEGNQQQVQQQQQLALAQQSKGQETVVATVVQRAANATERPPPPAFRYRLDSDITTGTSDADYSTDDESRFGGGSCACSQPCSRRSSLGGGPSAVWSLPCSRRSSGGQAQISAGVVSSAIPTRPPTAPPNEMCNCPCCRTLCSMATSRRSSYGSQANLSSATSDEGKGPSSTSLYNRVAMANKAKFQRINKAKSRSLEELRGKLRWTLAPEEKAREESFSPSKH